MPSDYGFKSSILRYLCPTKKYFFENFWWRHCVWFVVWAPPNQKSWQRLWSGLHEIFCAIQKRGFLTCILCRKLPSKLEFYQNFQVNSLLSFRVKHFSAAATELLATTSNLLLLQAKVFSDAQKNVHLLSTSRYLICLKYNSNFACNLAENCRLQLCAFLTSHSQKKNGFVYVFATNFELLQLKIFFSKLVKVLVLELLNRSVVEWIERLLLKR